MKIFDVNCIIFCLLRVLSCKNIFSILEFQGKYHMANQKNNINSFP